MNAEIIVLIGVWGFAIATAQKKEIRGWFMIAAWCVALLTSVIVLS
jgi:hypothetical protein